MANSSKHPEFPADFPGYDYDTRYYDSRAMMMTGRYPAPQMAYGFDQYPPGQPGMGVFPPVQSHLGSQVHPHSVPIKTDSDTANSEPATPRKPGRRERHPVPDHKKNKEYLEKRYKNNEAAKKSREAKRLKEERKERELEELRKEVDELWKERQMLKCQNDILLEIKKERDRKISCDIGNYAKQR